MKSRAILGAILGISCCLESISVSAELSAAENEERQVRFAERVIAIELARTLSPTTREARERCFNVCSETGALELGIGLIGVSRSNAASEALINLLGLRLDGAGSEEVKCQILTRGKAFYGELKKMHPELVAEHCSVAIKELRKRELFDVLDVGIERICRSEREVLNLSKELLQAINSGVACELE